MGSAIRWTAVHAASLPVEAYGLLVMFLGAVSWLGIYAGGAGPVGAAIDYIVSLVGGRMVVFVPPIALASGLLLIVGRTREHVGRILVGVVLCSLALASMVHLARGNKPLATPLEKLQEIGGIAGALIAHPLSGVIGVFASWVVMILLFGVGLMVITRTPASMVWEWAVTGTSSTWAFAKGLAAGVLEADEEEEDEDEEEEDEEYSDEYSEGDEDEDEDGLGESYEEEEDGPEGVPRLVPVAASAQQLAMPVPNVRSYKLPPIELLTNGEAREISTRSIEETTNILEATLEQFDVDASVTGYTAGPTVTRFEIELGSGVKVNRVLSLSNEIKYALASGRAPVPRADPGSLRHRGRGPEPNAAARHARRPPPVKGGQEGRPPPVGGPRPGHLGRDRDVQAHRDASRPDRRGNELGQVLVHQLDDHEHPDASPARSGAHDPDRPEAGRADPLRGGPSSPDARRDGPEEGCLRAELGRARDGDALRDACALGHA